MKRLSLILLLCCAIGPVSGKQVVEWDRAEILTRGSIGLPDILRTLEPLRFWSTDRYSLRLVGLGMGGAHAQGPTVLVDNLPMTSPFFDRTPYELVPVISSDIASIQFRSGINMAPGGDLADGIIEIETVRPTGFSLRGSVGLTNETGDPGPAIYSNSDAKNVDRSGPTSGIRMSWGNQRVYVQAGFDTDAYHMTDQRLEGRIWRLYAGNRKPLVTHSAPNIRVSVLAPRFHMEMKAGHTTKNDFLFDEIAGREWPHKEYRTWALAEASAELTDRWMVALTSGYTHLRTGNLAAQQVLPGNLEWTSGFGQLNVRTTQGFGAWSAFIGGKVRDLGQEEGSQNRRIPRGPISRIGFGQTKLDLTIGRRSILSVAAGMQSPIQRFRSLPQWSFFSSVFFRHVKSSGGTLEASISIGSDVSDDLLTTQNLIMRGVAFGDWATSITPPPFRTRSQTVELSLFSSSFVRPNLLLWVALRGRTIGGLTAPERSFIKDESDLQFASATSFKIGQQGRVVSPSIGLVVTRSNTKVRLSYQYIRLIVGDNLYFWKQFSGLSPHHVTGSLTFKPVSRFYLFFLARMGTEATWPDYANDGYGKLPGTLQLEGTLTKEFWKQNMRLSLSFLNMLDSPLIRHPAGVDEQFAVRLGVVVRFSDAEASNDGQ